MFFRCVNTYNNLEHANTIRDPYKKKRTFDKIRRRKKKRVRFICNRHTLRA